MNMSAYTNAMTSLEFDNSFETNTLLRLYSELQKRRQRRTALVRGGIGLAACAAVGAILVMSVRTAKAPDPAPIAAVSPLTASVAETLQPPDAAADERAVVISSEYGGGSLDSYASPPSAGQALIAWGISRAVEDPSNTDAYYFVRIDIFTPEQNANPLSEYVYGGRSIAEWRVLTDLANGTYPFSEYNGDHGGSITQAQWQSAQEEARALDAQANLDAALKEFEAEIEPLLAAAKSRHEEAELARQLKLGCDVFFMNTWSYKGMAEKEPARILAGLLSAEQLRNCAEGSSCGFFIDWVTNGDGIVDWNESLRP